MSQSDRLNLIMWRNVTKNSAHVKFSSAIEYEEKLGYDTTKTVVFSSSGKITGGHYRLQLDLFC